MLVHRIPSNTPRYALRRLMGTVLVPASDDGEPPYTSPGMDTLAVAADVLRLLSAQKATRAERQREQYRSWIL